MKRLFPNQKTLLIFTGGPGTGKSGTACRFIEYLENDEIVKVSYDEIKEKNWDIFGFDNEQQKERLNWWCLEEFYLTIQKRMWENKTILIEYPFYQRHKPKLEELIAEYDYDAVTVYLYTDMQTVYERGTARDGAGDRHPGHLLTRYHRETYRKEQLSSVSRIAPDFEEFTLSIRHKQYNINLGLDIPVDVTDFSTIDYEDIFQRIVTYERERGRRSDKIDKFNGNECQTIGS